MKILNNIKYSSQVIDNNIKDKIHNILSSSGIQDEYIRDGKLSIIKAVEHIGYDVRLTRFLENRFVLEDYVPNKTSVPKRLINKETIDLWDHEFKFEECFVESKEDIILEDTQHAKSCDGCRETGKNTCYTCSGAGSNTCSTCNGRGENRCSSCSGNGENRCMWCSGSGRVTEGSGDQQRVRNCNSCNGRGVKPCSSCRNGYVGCTTCATQGKVTCYSCSGSGDVVCDTCDGYKTLNHFYRLHVVFHNQNLMFSPTEFEEAHSVEKLRSADLDLRVKMDEIVKADFSVSDIEVVESEKVRNKLEEFFLWEITDEDDIRNLQDKIELYKKTIIEVEFVLHDRQYVLYLNGAQDNYFFNAAIPSDYYEVDLISVAYNRLKEDDSNGALKIIEEIAKFDGTKIDESELVEFISNSMVLREAYDRYIERKFIKSESLTKDVSKNFKQEKIFKYLKGRLNVIYTKSTISSFVFVSLPVAAILYFVINPIFYYKAGGMLCASLLVVLAVNFIIRRKYIASTLPNVLFFCGLAWMFFGFYDNPRLMASDRVLEMELSTLLANEDLAVLDGDTLIIKEYTGKEVLGEKYYVSQGTRIRIYSEYRTVNDVIEPQGYYRSEYTQKRKELFSKSGVRSGVKWQSFIDMESGSLLTVQVNDIEVEVDEFPKKEILGIKANILDLRNNNVITRLIDHDKIIYSK